MKLTSRSASRALAAALLVAATTGGAVLAATFSASAATTLGASAAATGRYFGAAVTANKLGDSTYVGILNREFNQVTAENEMKWDATEPSQGNFTFANGDRIANHARDSGMIIRGHALLGTRRNPSGPGWVPLRHCGLSTGLPSALTT
ncbi:endo-1,4-beta-xylanase [Saccharothrix sp. NRRL B-16348]|uniref:endo-1,4-beta-xylanase n=1 Tax=Saccharothrix sp. NRRL B-16348 TaxID=1415542 RepID=UPI0012F83BD3|nr:endo-1,4-beta-xylanase [Saccharothrix sp. NRRL B-16348]